MLVPTLAITNNNLILILMPILLLMLLLPLLGLYNLYFKLTFESVVGINQFNIAYSQPLNIKHTITKAKLHQAPGKEAGKYYSGELSNE